MDVHHRRTHADTGYFALKCALEFPVIMRYVRRGTAHIKPDNLFEPRSDAGACCAHHASGGARQNTVLALEKTTIHQAAVRLHEQQAYTTELCSHGVYVTSEYW